MIPRRVVVGLGSNVGDRLSNLRMAVARVAAVAPIARASSIYESAPIGGPPQDAFLNAALLLSTSLEPRALLRALQAIEHDLGRVRDVRWGPRTIDLDVLWIEDLALDEVDLVVPHPRLHERAFALTPLLEIVPEARHPRTNEPFAHVADASVRVFGDLTPAGSTP